MPLSWNEIRDRSLAFTREWADECSEDAEAKSFWDGFFIPEASRSNTIVYKNFPWPEITTPQPPPESGGGARQGGGGMQDAIEAAAQAVLDARANYPTSTLADLYDPLTMPPDLVKAHQALDKAVDAAYGRTNFKTEAERVAFLFERYQQLTAPLVTAEKSEKKKRRGAQP